MNKFLKRALLVVMCLAILLPSFCFAAPSATLASISGAVVTVSNTEALYDGKVKSATVAVTLDGKALAAGTDYVVSGNTTPSAKVGSYTLTITVNGVGMYTGSVTKTATFTISKATQKITAKGNIQYTLSKKALKTQKITLSPKIKGNITKLRIMKCPDGFKLNKKGKIVVAKGMKKGTYTLRVRAYTGINAKSSNTIRIKIIVK